MKKDYWRTVIDVIRRSTLVLIVLDARFPDETRNISIEKKIVELGKKFIYVINKVDLVDNDILKTKVKDLQPNVFVSSKFNLGTTILRKKIFQSIKKKPVYISVVGYPNTGKSSLINCLKQKKSTRVSPFAGLTRGVQKLKIGDGIYLIDTPGVIPLSAKSESIRAMTNIKNPENIKDIDLVAMEIIDKFVKKNPKRLEEFYKIKVQKTSEKTLDVISRKLNHLRKGGELDTDRTARKIIFDWQRGRLVLE